MPDFTDGPRPEPEKKAIVHDDRIDLPESFPVHPALGDRVSSADMKAFASSLSLQDLQKLFQRVADNPVVAQHDADLGKEARRISDGLNGMQSTGLPASATEILDDLDVMAHELMGMADAIRHADMHNEERDWGTIKANWEVSNALNALADALPVPDTVPE
jgi:hypothetical protein